jgi:hypothetical protein
LNCTVDARHIYLDRSASGDRSIIDDIETDGSVLVDFDVLIVHSGDCLPHHCPVESANESTEPVPAYLADVPILFASGPRSPFEQSLTLHELKRCLR